MRLKVMVNVVMMLVSYEVGLYDVLELKCNGKQGRNETGDE